jgi:hypothetical protein
MTKYPFAVLFGGPFRISRLMGDRLNDKHVTSIGPVKDFGLPILKKASLLCPQ